MLTFILFYIKFQGPDYSLIYYSYYSPLICILIGYLRLVKYFILYYILFALYNKSVLFYLRLIFRITERITKAGAERKLALESPESFIKIPQRDYIKADIQNLQNTGIQKLLSEDTVLDKFDKTDRKILEILQNDGRITNSELAKQLGLSPSSTLERVKKLEQSGTIKKYVALVDGNAVKRNTIAFVLVTIDWYTDAVLKKFHAQIKKLPEVLECYSIAGEFDYLLKVVVSDMEEYSVLLHEKLTKNAGIRNVRTSFVMAVHKYDTALPNLAEQ